MTGKNLGSSKAPKQKRDLTLSDIFVICQGCRQYEQGSDFVVVLSNPGVRPIRLSYHGCQFEYHPEAVSFFEEFVIKPALAGHNPSGILHYLNKSALWRSEPFTVKVVRELSRDFNNQVREACKKKKKLNPVRSLVLDLPENLLVILPDGRRASISYEDLENLAH